MPVWECKIQCWCEEALSYHEYHREIDRNVFYVVKPCDANWSTSSFRTYPNDQDRMSKSGHDLEHKDRRMHAATWTKAFSDQKNRWLRWVGLCRRLSLPSLDVDSRKIKVEAGEPIARLPLIPYAPPA
jgi:hypothetical protein